MGQDDGRSLSGRATPAEPKVSALREGIANAERLGQWLHSYDTGLSSLAIFHYMTLGVTGGATPSDSSDLGRCVRLLGKFPEWRSRMDEMACVSDSWAALVSIWGDLVDAYNDDLKNKPDKWRSDEMLSDLFYDKSQPGIWIRKDHGFKAQGMETGTAKTEGLGPKDDSPVGTMRPKPQGIQP